MHIARKRRGQLLAIYLHTCLVCEPVHSKERRKLHILRDLSLRNDGFKAVKVTVGHIVPDDCYPNLPLRLPERLRVVIWSTVEQSFCCSEWRQIAT